MASSSNTSKRVHHAFNKVMQSKLGECYGEFAKRMEDQKNTFNVANPEYGMLRKLLSVAEDENVTEQLMAIPVPTKPGDAKQTLWTKRTVQQNSERNWDELEVETAFKKLPTYALSASNTIFEHFVYGMLQDAFDVAADNRDWGTYKGNFEQVPNERLLKLVSDLNVPDDKKKKRSDLLLHLEDTYTSEGKLKESDAMNVLSDAHKSICVSSFHNPTWDTLSKAFGTLFGIGTDLWSILMFQCHRELPTTEKERFRIWNLQIPTTDGRILRYLVKAKDVRTLLTLSRLFYGARCVIVHGNRIPTISAGVLSLSYEQIHLSLEVVYESVWKGLKNEKSVYENEPIATEKQDALSSECVTYLRNKWNHLKEKANENPLDEDYYFYLNARNFWIHNAYIIAIASTCMVCRNRTSESSSCLKDFCMNENVVKKIWEETNKIMESKPLPDNMSCCGSKKP